MANLELRDVLRAISATLRRVMHCDVAGVQLLEAEHHQLRVYALDFPDSQGFIQEDLLIPLEGSLPGQALQAGQPVVVDRSDPAEISCLIAGEGLQSTASCP